jgi:hypothetical protein
VPTRGRPAAIGGRDDFYGGGEEGAWLCRLRTLTPPAEDEAITLSTGLAGEAIQVGGKRVDVEDEEAALRESAADSPKGRLHVRMACQVVDGIVEAVTTSKAGRRGSRRMSATKSRSGGRQSLRARALDHPRREVAGRYLVAALE